MQLPARLANRAGSRSLTSAMTAGLGSGTPPTLSLNNDSFTLIDSSGLNLPIEGKSIDVVVVDVNLEVPVQRVFWGLDEQGQPRQGITPGVPPVCFSDNGIGASASASEPQSVSCRGCRFDGFHWVSRMNPASKTKACKTIKKIVIFPVWGDEETMRHIAQGQWVQEYRTLDWMKFPFLLRVPFTSHQNLGVYGRKFAGQQFDVSDVVTRISWVLGTKTIDFTAVGFTDDATEEKVARFIADRKGDELLGRGDVPWNGQRGEAIAATAARPQIQAPLPGDGPSPRQPAPQSAQAEPEKPKRGRPPAPKPSAQSTQSNGGDGIPPFLRRPSAPGPQQGAQQQPGLFAPPTPTAPAASSHGIVSNAPSPSGEMEKALKSVFGLKTS